MFVDFQELKQSVRLEDVIAWLQIPLKPSGKHQLRGCCPIHHGDNEREFVVTPAKGLWYCFAGCGGGDMIKLVAKIRGLEQKDAALEIAKQFGKSTVPAARNSTVRGTVPVPHPAAEKEKAGTTCPTLDYLQPEHEAIQRLGISLETCQHFAAGYAPKGILRGRFAIPVHDLGGKLLAYCGRAVGNEEPKLIFPKNFDPSTTLFNAHRIEHGDLVYVACDPLHVLLAHESGAMNVVSFLADITSDSLQVLGLFMDERSVPSIELLPK